MFFKSLKPGTLLIMAAASLWAIDALFRTQLTYTIPPASIVFLEHLIGFAILSPIFFRNWRWIKTMEKKDWLNFLGLTIVSSVLGGLLFTEALAKSFAQNDFVTPILLQKLQPIFVVLLSAMILKEKVTMRFLALATAALLGSYLMTFGTEIVQLTLQGKELVYLLALGAAFSWGAGTIMSKHALKKVDFPEATSLRFLLAIPVSLIFAYMFNQTYDVTQLAFDQIWRLLVIATVTGGAGAIFIYYKGLQKTDAKISTFAELTLPVVSIFIAITPLNPYGEAQQLTLANIVGIVILVVSILKISSKKTVDSTPSIAEEK